MGVDQGFVRFTMRCTSIRGFDVTTRHEQGAGFMADGYARASGRVGVALTTTGPAAVR